MNPRAAGSGLFLLLTLVACGDGTDDVSSGNSGSAGDVFDAFSDNVTIWFDGDDIVFESNGLPDHESPYWSPSSELYAAEDGVALAPGYIDDFTGSYTLTVPSEPEVASSSSSTPMGPIGIAVSGAMIYNDQEGQNQPIDSALVSLDSSGAHTGPQSYHYHLEPKAWTDDDDELVGIMADGFYIYGRKCDSTGGHPEDLDESGGHESTTQYNDQSHYHYHIINELYLGEYYIIFAEDYQGTPSSVQ